MNRYITYIKTFNRYKYLLSLFVKRDLKRKYKGSYLGILWSLLNPLFHMTVLSIVFSTLFDTHIGNFPVYMLSGFLIFQFFSTSTSQSMNSIIHSSHLISKVYLPKYILTVSTILSNFIFFGISLVVLIIIMLITRVDLTLNILYAPVYLILLFIFCCGISLILATITVFFRDIEHIYGVLLTVLNYASAIFYPADIIPKDYQFILTMNPIYYYVNGFRDVVYSGIEPSLINIMICFSLAFVSIIVGILVFEKNQHKFILYL